MPVLIEPIISPPVSGIITGAAPIPLDLMVGGTVSGNLGTMSTSGRGEVIVNDTSAVTLVTVVGETYVVTLSDPDQAGYLMIIEGEEITPAYDPITSTYSYAFIATSTSTDLLLFDDGELSPGNYTLLFDLAAPFAPTEGTDVGEGTAEADTFDLLGGNDVYTAGDGVDRIRGGTGDDTIVGEGGNDIMFGGDGADSLFGGADKDGIRGGDGADLIDGGEGNDKLWGDAGNDIITGGADNDSLFGELGDDSIAGGNGNDKISAGSGNDTAEGGAGADIINGGNGDDLIHAGEGNDAVRGGGGNDTVNGDSGRDNLFGDSGDDVMNGGTGNDKLTGGSGADTFVFETGHGADIVKDFDTSEDVLDFSGIFIPIVSGLDGPFLPDINFYAEYATQNGANVVFTIDGGDSVTLLNTDLGDLSASNFILPDLELFPEIGG